MNHIHILKTKDFGDILYFGDEYFDTKSSLKFSFYSPINIINKNIKSFNCYNLLNNKKQFANFITTNNIELTDNKHHISHNKFNAFTQNIKQYNLSPIYIKKNNNKLSISRTKITQKQYNTAIKTLRTLNRNGMNSNDRKALEEFGKLESNRVVPTKE